MQTTRMRLAYLASLLALFAGIGGSLLTHAAPAITSQRLRQIWRHAHSIGQYSYQSTLVQTLHPTPRIENVGRRGATQQVTVTGEVDLRRQIFTLQIRRPGEKRQQLIDLKFADNIAYGRLAESADWTEIDELSDLVVSDLFAQSGGAPWAQPGLLAAAENVHELAPGQGDDLLFDRLLDGTNTNGLTRYVFDLNGPRYSTRLQRIIVLLAVVTSLLILAWMVIRHQRSPRIYAGLVGSIALAMIAGPLLQVHVAYAASKRLSDRQARTLERQSAIQTQDAPFDPVSSGAPLTIGSNGAPFAPYYYVGALDDLVIFDRALTNAEANLLAQAQTWHPASLAAENLAATNWQYVVSNELEGPYKIDLLTEDLWGNRRYIPNAWSGEIDTLAPRLALGYILSADRRTVEVSCAAADYNLTLDGWACPADGASLTQHNKDAQWFTTIFGDVQKLAGLSTGAVVLTPGPGISMAACDGFGHCAAEAPTDTDGDGIPDHVEGEGDRDGDGILDAHDYDPDGHFYESGTGQILSGGRIAVDGPGAVEVGRDGSDGYYEWSISVLGLYTLQITPPDNYKVSPECPAQPGPFFDPGDSLIFLGKSEVGNTGNLVDGSCAANPYYLSFNIQPGEPYIYNNNIPFIRSTPGASYLPLIMTIGAQTIGANERQIENNGEEEQALSDAADMPVQENTIQTQDPPQHWLFLPAVFHNE